MSIEFKLPELGENVETGDVVNVLVAEGDTIEANQPVCELETDKAVVEIPCPHAGKIVQVHFQKGDTVNVGQVLLTLEAEEGAPAAEEAPSAGEAAPASAPEESPPAEQAPPAETGASCPIPAGPAARRLARRLGVDLRGVRGSGTRGRITADDVRAAAGPGAATIHEPEAAPATAASAATASLEPVVPPGEPGEDAWGPVRREKMSRIRQTIAAQMSRSASTIPHVTNFDDADVTDLENLRKGVPKGYLGANVKLTAMPFVMKSVAIGLRRHPLVNASLDEESHQIIYKQYVHVGVAVDTPRGLVVPAIRNVDRMTIPEIARALASVAERARAAQFSVDDLRGGTFTVSNLGAVGGQYSTPIINYPEAALLLLGRSRWMPVVREGKIEPRLLMPLSLSYDHRIIDGATAARFLNEVIDLLQSPGRLLLAE
ncbi:MAG TPA: dihydrolipoamide acetyltransferase family protein [Thermoguttaceae bacterium]|nr:dihydrolipoamide acetyltransferase family protein [Thermoguttaceae bacterium]